MTSSDKNNARPHSSWIKVLLFPVALLLLSALPAHADNCVADLGGVVDGYVNPVPPSQVQIDGNCTFRNFPVSNPLTTNISFFTNPGNNNQRWLVIFDNVDFIGNMSCDAVQGNHIWFVNGSFTNLQPNCQNIFIPVEKIDKQNPAGQTTAAIGVPFTYKLTIPVLYSPLKGSGTPVSHSFSNVGGVLTFSNFPIIPAGQQIVIDVTVVLPSNPANTPGTHFVNT